MKMLTEDFAIAAAVYARAAGQNHKARCVMLDTIEFAATMDDEVTKRFIRAQKGRIIDRRVTAAIVTLKANGWKDRNVNAFIDQMACPAAELAELLEEQAAAFLK